MAVANDARWSVSDEVQKKIIPSLDQSRFLGFDGDERINLYVFAAALASARQLPPSGAKNFKGIVRMESVSEEVLTQLILIYLAMNAGRSLETVIDNVAKSRRKELVRNVDQIANSGFRILRDLNSRSEDLVIADLIGEMDSIYMEYQKKHPEYRLPACRKFVPPSQE